MTETDYWTHMEFRLCREFGGLLDRSQRTIWCDGLIPEEFCFDVCPPRVTGIAWMGGIKGEHPRGHQERWRFTLFLPSGTESREAIDWQTLLPADTMTYWMSFDEGRRELEIDPTSAKPAGGPERAGL